MSDEHWLNLRELMGRPDWSLDPALDSAAERFAQRETIDAHVSAWTGTQSAVAVMERCQAAGVPAGVVQTGVDLLEHDPQLAAVQFCQPIEDVNPAIGQTWADRLPLHFDKTPCEHYSRVREVGEDNAAVLSDWLGMSADEVAAGEADGRLR